LISLKIEGRTWPNFLIKMGYDPKENEVLTRFG
jgi:hypothetical protein